MLEEQDFGNIRINTLKFAEVDESENYENNKQLKIGDKDPLARKSDDQPQEAG